jgi:transcriptional regulator with XRE-family HTH domain
VKELKRRIKELRSSMGLTQQQFADRLGLKRQTIAAYEVGNTEPSNATLLSICREYKVNENWLRTGEGEMKVAQTTQERYNLNLEKLQRVDDETIIRWVNTIAETNPEVLRQIEEFMKRLLENQEDKG